jgi:bifunctional DNA-binding transcriptional regulator/antitoxin component of YhaV-PrlF toxin-antitoxin module
METVKILAGNRITIPPNLLKEWGMKEGDIVGLKLNERLHLVVIPLDVVEKQIG